MRTPGSGLPGLRALGFGERNEEHMKRTHPWGYIGATLGYFGVTLGLLWGYLGLLWGYFGAALGIALFGFGWLGVWVAVHVCIHWEQNVLNA